MANFCDRRIKLEIEPTNDETCCLVERHLLFPRNEVEDVATATALVEAVPEIDGEIRPEGDLTIALVNRAYAGGVFAILLQSAHEAVMLKNLADGDFAFDRLEVDDFWFGHGMLLSGFGVNN